MSALIAGSPTRSALPLWHPAMLAATWFGIGRLPFASGSWGSLAALPVAWAVTAEWGIPGLALAFTVVFAIGWWAAGAVAKASGARDPGIVVIDEVCGQWLVLLPAPRDPVAWLLAFVLFRLFDIWKPWPVRWVDRNIMGGSGIMLDDVAAAGYALLVLAVGLAIGRVAGVRI